MDKQIAKIISAVFEPYTVAAVTTFLVFLKVGVSDQQKLTWFLVGFLVGAMPPIAVLFYEKQKGKISDWFMSSRSERRDVQLAWVFGAACFTSLALVNDLPRVLLALSLSFFSLSLSVTVINSVWKISVHTSMITFAVVTLALVYSSGFALLAILILLVLWARIRLGAHTLSQACAGAALSLLLQFFWFNFFGLATF